MKTADIKLILRRKPSYLITVLVVMLLFLAGALLCLNRVVSYVIRDGKLNFVARSITTHTFDTNSLSHQELANVKLTLGSVSKKTPAMVAVKNKLEEARLIYETMNSNIAQLNAQYTDVSTELGLMQVAFPNTEHFEPLNFKDTFYKTQQLIINEATKSGFFISDKSFGFEVYETKLPKKEELDILYPQLAYVKELTMLMIRSKMESLKNIELAAPREIESKNFKDPLLKEFEFKLASECSTASLMRFLIDVNKLNPLFIVNDIAVEKKKENTKSVSAVLDISVFEPVLKNANAESQAPIVKTIDPQQLVAYNALIQRDIFNKYEPPEVIKKAAEEKKAKIEQSLPLYKGFIELPDGTLIAQINLQNKTYFAKEGDTILDYIVVRSITKEGLELRNSKDLRSQRLRYKQKE
ncbi:MAG: Amuc_1100 family pilus-like protein [Candidatus Omnitrophota bacterium]